MIGVKAMAPSAVRPTGQSRRDLLPLDPPRTAPTGSAQRSRAGRRQQKLASSRRHGLKGASAAGGALVRSTLVAGMAEHLVPSDFAAVPGRLTTYNSQIHRP